MNHFTTLMGDLTIWAGNVAFAWYDRVAGAITGTRVGTITTADLQRAISSRDAFDYVVVDVRDTAERSVSMIPGAIGWQQYEADLNSYKDRTLIAYCTIGGRSYLYARKMQRRGIVAINYRDSIIGWCRAGLPLENREREPTLQVHPYWSIFQVPPQYQVRFGGDPDNQN